MQWSTFLIPLYETLFVTRVFGRVSELCVANFHVSNHVCTPCPEGTTRLPGDETSGVDTTCAGPNTWPEEVCNIVKGHCFSSEVREKCAGSCYEIEVNRRHLNEHDLQQESSSQEVKVDKLEPSMKMFRRAADVIVPPSGEGRSASWDAQRCSTFFDHLRCNRNTYRSVRGAYVRCQCTQLRTMGCLGGATPDLCHASLFSICGREIKGLVWAQRCEALRAQGCL